jgi:hypothetical protein
VSRTEATNGTLHVSLSRPEARADVVLLCELAARSFPALEADDARLTSGSILHVLVPADGAEGFTTTSRPGALLYGAVVRRLQQEDGERAPDDRGRRAYFAAS